jgi:hypothetical protein
MQLLVPLVVPVSSYSWHWAPVKGVAAMSAAKVAWGMGVAITVIKVPGATTVLGG